MEGSLQLTLSSATTSLVDADLPRRQDVLDCFICLEPPTNPIFASCGHVFCWPCMYQWLQNGPKPCPVCRHTLRRDRDIIPLHGVGGARGVGGTREEPSNGNGRGRPGEIVASNSFIPPRPRNPLLVRASASTDDAVATGIQDFRSGIIPRSVISAYVRSFDELTDAFLLETARASGLEVELNNLQIQQNNLVQGTTVLSRELEEKHRELLLMRNEKMQNDARGYEVEQRNFWLFREAGASLEREVQLIEQGNQMGEHIVRLQNQLDRANQQLPSRE